MLTEYFFPFDRGGSEWSVLNLSQQLVKLGHAVEVFTPNYGAAKTDSFKKVEIFRFPFIKKLAVFYASITPYWHSNLLWFLSSAFYLIIRIISFKPTHLHVHGKYLIPAAIVVGKIFHIPVITTLRDYIVLCPFAYCLEKRRDFKACSFKELFTLDLVRSPQFTQSNVFVKFVFFFFALRGWMVSQLLKYFLQRCDAIVGISTALSSIYQKNGIKKIQTIYNTETQLPVLGNKSENYILYVGRLSEGKGFYLLMEAYRLMKSAPKLICIGQGFLEKEYRRQDNVILLGHVPHAKISSYYRNAKLVIMPSIWPEPFGRVALEALFCGTPVIATNSGALPEIIEHNRTGIIVSPDAKSLQFGIMNGLKLERIFRRNISHSYQKLIHKFSYMPIRQYEELYERLL